MSLVSPHDWRRAEPHVTTRGLEICGEVVVSGDERAVQELLASALISRVGDGRLMETGYGLGMSAARIRSSFGGRHWIVEGNFSLAAKASSGKVRSNDVIICDLWESVVGYVPSGFFKGVFFDPYVFTFQIGFDAGWHDRFVFAVRAAKDALLRSIAPDGYLGFLNFEPSSDMSWLADCFGKSVVIDSRLTPNEQTRVSDLSCEACIIRFG